MLIIIHDGISSETLTVVCGNGIDHKPHETRIFIEDSCYLLFPEIHVTI